MDYASKGISFISDILRQICILMLFIFIKEIKNPSIWDILKIYYYSGG